MTKMPWVRFFPSDWLGGTRGMSAVETGVYITLIATMYERGEPIVEDHSRLARLCGASNSAFKKALETLIDEGKITRSDRGLWNDRVEKEQVYLSEKSEVGSRAANARWNKNDNKNNGGDDANALRGQSEGNANQKPDTRNHSRDANASISKDFDREFETEFWPIYPRKVGKGQALKAYRAARKQADCATIVAGARRYASERAGQDQQFTRHASTWLNGAGWLDEPSSPPRPSANSPPRERTVLDAVNDRLREEDAARYDPFTIDHEPLTGSAPSADIRLPAASQGRRW